MKKSKSHSFEYFTFPISLLPILLVDRVKFCQYVVAYSAYSEGLKLFDGYNEEDAVAMALQLIQFEVNDIKEFTKQARRIFDEHRGMDITTSLRTTVIFDYMTSKKKKPKDDLELLVYTAFKSIGGKRGYGKTNNLFLWSRMAGLRTAVNCPEELPQAIRDRVATRTKTNTLKEALELRWHVKFYGNRMRGFTFTLNERKCSLEALIEWTTTKQIKNARALLKREKMEAERRVLQKMGIAEHRKRPQQTRPAPPTENKPVRVIIDELKMDPDSIAALARSKGIEIDPSIVATKLDAFGAEIVYNGTRTATNYLLRQWFVASLLSDERDGQKPKEAERIVTAAPVAVGPLEKAEIVSEATGVQFSFLNDLKADKSFITACIQSVNEKDTARSENWVKSNLDRFANKLIASDEKKKDIEDFRRHFVNWLQHQPKPIDDHSYFNTAY
ncbi:MAG: hypothetical protein KBB38_06110 [Bacteroidia bacterium]|nr:hypothetical protein [Bacteroidia bacterium]MBP7728878.1 hypothetical protein [Bacteroidia bacterium]MBP7771513.1 hypothetical protein [Bacteroidia bacterium]